uniref:Uncharacterized protein n=1 Tax=Fagus sylvatica TaxID=28930 RepID=A0A2N9H367_FAGSY
MTARQMEDIQRKLAMLNYPRANAPAQSLLFAGMERYALLEWLFFRLLGDKSPFSQQTTQGDAMDRDEETSRIQCSVGDALSGLVVPAVLRIPVGEVLVVGIEAVVFGKWQHFALCS